MISLKKISIGLFFSGWAFSGITSIDEEQILLRKAALVAQKVHQRNMALLVIDPKTCKSTNNKKIIISQMGQIKTGKLNHCHEYVQSKLKTIDEEIKNVENGVLVYAPAKIPVASSSPVEQFEESSSTQVMNGSIEENIPALVSTPESSEVDYTGLDEEQRRRILLFHETDRSQSVKEEDDNLFSKLSNAYRRNLPKVMVKPKDP